MRAALLLIASVCGTAAAAPLAMPLPEEPIRFMPLQMADGAQLWRLFMRPIAAAEADAWIADQVARQLAAFHWCPRGWEEVKRSEPTKGLMLVEGRCK